MRKILLLITFEVFKLKAFFISTVDVPQPGLQYISSSLSVFLNSIPYGILWAGLNSPLWTLNLEIYKIYLLIFDLPLTIWSFRRFSWQRFSFIQYMVFIAMFDGWLMTTVYWTLTLIQSRRWFIGLAILQKLPIGWSFDLSDPHFQYGFGNTGWRFATLTRPWGYAVMICYGITMLVLWHFDHHGFPKIWNKIWNHSVPESSVTHQPLSNMSKFGNFLPSPFYERSASK